MKLTLQITLPYACAGITAEVEEIKEESPDTYEGIVIEPCAPIFKWMIGKKLTEIVKWVGSKKGKVETFLPCSNFYGVYGTND